MRLASSAASPFLALVALAHLGRVLFRIDVTAGGRTVPIRMSLVAFGFAGGLAMLLRNEERR
jgi:hypothetical protein